MPRGRPTCPGAWCWPAQHAPAPLKHALHTDKHALHCVRSERDPSPEAAMTTEIDSPVGKEARARASRRIIGSALAISAVILVAAWIGRQFPPRSAARIALALVQGGACAWLILASTRAPRQLDELQHRIQLEAMAFGFAGTAILGSTYGFQIGRAHV